MPKQNRPDRLTRPLAATLLIAAMLFHAAAWGADWRWQGVARIVAVSDVHGAFTPMVRTLQNAGIIDGEFAWSGGKSHLVIAGDILDRGPESRKVMDLLMRLEGEAREAGGQVHVLLGNHEVMNLTGDLRYVSAAEYAAFSGDESVSDRERAFQAFQAARPEVTDPEALRREFDRRTPPGYFGHRRAFAPDGRYGKWLLEKPLVVVINDTAFVHGGLSPMVTELGLEGINRELKEQVSRYARQFEVVAEAGLIDVTADFYQRPPLLEALAPDPQRSAELEQAIADIISLSQGTVHGLESPVWYRGNVACSPLIEKDKLDAALSALDAKRVVIGHTPTASRQVLQRLDGRVIEIDTGMLNAHYGGSGHALVIEGDGLAVVSESGPEVTPPAPQPRPTGLELSKLSASEVERILAKGAIRSITEDESGKTIVTLHDGSADVVAIFTRKPRGKDFAPELAAYRLDRLLALGMVPVTVAREVDGDAGTLQVRIAKAVDEGIRRDTGGGFSAFCPLPEQWQAMYVYDALTYNALREPESMLYTPGDWRLMLTEHGETFEAKSGRPPWLEEVDLEIGNAWREALAALTDDVLAAELGDMLSERRLEALMERRDALLEE